MPIINGGLCGEKILRPVIGLTEMVISMKAYFIPWRIGEDREKPFEVGGNLFIFHIMSENFIWAPWRSGYILGPKEKGCLFCNRIRRHADVKDLIVFRGKKMFVILNRYPYNSGHAMVVPYRHLNSLDKFSEEEAKEFFELIWQTINVIRKALRPDSFNIGMNLGRGSGAGVPGHVHMHIVPRWSEDTSFMPVIGKTRVVSFGLDMIYRILKREFDSLCREQRSRQKRS